MNSGKSVNQSRVKKRRVVTEWISVFRVLPNAGEEYGNLGPLCGVFTF